MDSEIDRLATFVHWPKNKDNPYFTFLADAGFYYVENEEKLKCYLCHFAKSVEDCIDLNNYFELHDCDPKNKVKLEELKEKLTSPLIPQPRHGVIEGSQDSLAYLDVNKASHFDDNLEKNDSADCVENKSIDELTDLHDCMKYETERLKSFSTWPKNDIIDPKLLAADGFVKLPNGDAVKCFFCNKVFRNWEPGILPRERHKQHYPNCDFVLGNPICNIPITTDLQGKEQRKEKDAARYKRDSKKFEEISLKEVSACTRYCLDESKSSKLYKKKQKSEKVSPRTSYGPDALKDKLNQKLEILYASWDSKTKQSNETPKGWENIAYSCFIISLLQAFYFTVPLKEYCFNTDTDYISELERTFICVLKSQGCNIQPFRNAIYKNKDLKVFYSGQHNAGKFLATLLNAFLSRQWKVNKKYKKMQLEDIIKFLFLGKLQSTVTCQSCKHKSVIEKEFWYLQLTIMSDKLEECINNYFFPSEKEQCLKCKQFNCVVQKLISQMPHILILELDRSIGKNIKSTRIVYFRNEINMSQYVIPTHNDDLLYFLYCVINHCEKEEGQLEGGGHYTTIGLNNADGEWYKCDAEQVVKIKEDVLQSSKASLLFYRVSREVNNTEQIPDC